MTDEIPEKYQKYVVTDLPRYVEVEGHHAPAPFWITPHMFPGVNFRVAGLDASKLIGTPHADPHVHDGPEIYLAASENKGELVIQVRMDDTEFLAESPFAIFVPAGVKHCFTVIKCESPTFIFGIMPMVK